MQKGVMISRLDIVQIAALIVAQLRVSLGGGIGNSNMVIANSHANPSKKGAVGITPNELIYFIVLLNC